MFLSTGEYEDGSLGEVFLRIGKAGSELAGWVNSFAITMSVALQHGVPLEALAKNHLDSNSHMGGMVRGSEHIKMCSSWMDYVFRELLEAYPGKDAASPPVATVDKDVNVVIEDNAVVPLVPSVYSGNACPDCGKFTLKRNGSCWLCDSCGITTGCS